MQCTSCRAHSDNLREYSRAVDLGGNRKTIETIFLCAPCRVINAINPKYVVGARARRIRQDSAGERLIAAETRLPARRTRHPMTGAPHSGWSRASPGNNLPADDVTRPPRRTRRISQNLLSKPLPSRARFRALADSRRRRDRRHRRRHRAFVVADASAAMDQRRTRCGVSRSLRGFAVCAIPDDRTVRDRRTHHGSGESDDRGERSGVRRDPRRHLRVARRIAQRASALRNRAPPAAARSAKTIAGTTRPHPSALREARNPRRRIGARRAGGALHHRQSSARRNAHRSHSVHRRHRARHGAGHHRERVFRRSRRRRRSRTDAADDCVCSCSRPVW